MAEEALYIRQSEEAERAIAAADVVLREHDRHPSDQSALRVAESLACAGRLVRTAKAAMRGSAPRGGAPGE